MRRGVKPKSEIPQNRDTNTPPRLHLNLAAFVLLSGLVFWGEVQADAVHAMPLVGGCGISLALENMAEVTAAVGADDLGSRHAMAAVHMAGDGAGDAVKVSGPPAARLKFVVRLVEWRIATGAGINALARVVLVKLPSSRGLRSLLPEDTELLYIGC